MTEEAPRPYTPETREVPLTFLDCKESYQSPDHPHRKVCNFNDQSRGWYCRCLREWKKCPLGFTQ